MTNLPTPLVSTAWLAEHLDDADLRIVDASSYLPNAGRDAKAEYDLQHIPGAVFADINWMSDASAPFPHTLLSTSEFEQRMGALGISNNTHVVVYDGSGQNFSAPRFWWMMRIFGHRQVSVLDGGISKWMREERDLSVDVPVIIPADFHATLDASRVVDIEAMKANEKSRAVQMVDARSSGRFEATEPEPRAGVRGGHIPGARSLHYAKLVNADGTLKSESELRALVDAAGLDLSKPIIASCGTGVTACAVVLAFEVLGNTDAKVYDGSWTEWGSAADTPVATGP